MLIEHASAADDYKGVWYFTEAVFDYVASARRYEWRFYDDMFNGASRHKRCVEAIAAESDDIEELKEWAREKLANGFDEVSFARTWPIPEAQAPKGHRLHGKRENGFLKVQL